MLGGMPVGRIVATTDVTTLPAQSEMQPAAAGLEAFLAAARARSDVMDRLQMRADVSHFGTSSCMPSSSSEHRLLYEISTGNQQGACAKVALVEHAKLESETLRHVDDRYYYGAFCRKCRHRARLSLEKLRAHLGPNFRLRDIQARLCCDRCGSKLISVTFLAPDEMGKDVTPLR